MLVAFRTNAWGNITMFGDVAVALLKMMGHSGAVPSALLARDIPAALARLKRQLASHAVEEDAGPHPNDDDEDAEKPVGLALRAHPLIEMLSAAAEQEADVMWQAGEPPL
jgi:Domain of unknown function (DUF1840)